MGIRLAEGHRRDASASWKGIRLISERHLYSSSTLLFCRRAIKIALIMKITSSDLLSAGGHERVSSCSSPLSWSERSSVPAQRRHVYTHVPRASNID